MYSFLLDDVLFVGVNGISFEKDGKFLHIKNNGTLIKTYEYADNASMLAKFALIEAFLVSQDTYIDLDNTL